ncbi:MAG: TIGR02444 family protein [Alphaproteobacteria bacterium]
MSAFPEHPFWDFSLEVYGAAGVAPACLALQERHGVDVNFLLLCLWLGRAGYGAVGAEEIARLHGAVDVWHSEIVRQLRAVRKRLKEPLAGEDRDLALALRHRLQKIEIDAEHIEQLMLGAALGKMGSGGGMGAGATGAGPAAARANLDAYFALIGAELDGEGRACAETLLTAAFANPD